MILIFFFSWFSFDILLPKYHNFLVFPPQYIYLSLNSQSIELYGFQKTKRKFLQHNLSILGFTTQFCSLPHQALKWYSLNFSHNPIFFLMISQNWSLCDCCNKILSEFLGLAICGVTSKNYKQTAACSIKKATTRALTC